MSRHRSFVLLLFAAVALATACGGSKRPPVLTSAPGGDADAGRGRDATPRSSSTLDSGPDVRAMSGDATSSSDFPSSETLGEGGPLADVHFELDRATLTDEAKATLEKHALWLQGHRDARVTVEGHCDERGTTDYNLALGEQRARVVRDYLASLGVAAARMRTVSYGKERPLVKGQNEEAYAQNRRAHFAVGAAEARAQR
jgi:peptidoglycan-associated lipoprotein